MVIAKGSIVLPTQLDFVLHLLICLPSVKCSKLSFYERLTLSTKIRKSKTKSNYMGRRAGTSAIIMVTLIFLALPNSSEYSLE